MLISHYAFNNHLLLKYLLVTKNAWTNNDKFIDHHTAVAPNPKRTPIMKLEGIRTSQIEKPTMSIILFVSPAPLNPPLRITAHAI